MNRILSTFCCALLAAVSSCGKEAGDFQSGDFQSVQSALITPRPRVDRIQGAICAISGGCEITIEGANFRAGWVTVLINKTTVSSCRTVTINKLICTVPASGGPAGAVALEVTNDPGNPDKSWSQPDGFFYVGRMVDPWPLRTLRTKGVPLSAVVADLNGDKYPDIAVISQGRDTVEVFLGEPEHRSFRPSVELAVGKSPSALLAADFNDDGKSDLAVANGASDNLTMLWGNDGSPYTARTTAPAIVAGTCKQPNALVSGNQNGDRYPELVMGCVGSSSAVAFFYDSAMGDLSYADRSINSAGTRDMRLAHANGSDDLFDLITLYGPANNTSIRYGRRPSWLQFGNDGPSVAALTGRSISSIAAGDIIEDGRIDLVALDSKEKEIWILPSSKTHDAFPVVLNKLKVRDEYKKTELIYVNGDKHLDIVAVLGSSNTANSFLGDGSGNFIKHQELSFGFLVPRVEFGDVDGDQLSDLLLLGADTPYTTEDDDGKAIHVIFNQGGDFLLPRNLAAGAHPAALIAANLDADAEAEVLSLDRIGKVMVLDEERAGGFSARPAVQLEEHGTLISADSMALSKDRTLAVLHSDADKFSTLKIDGKGDLSLEGFHEAVPKADRLKFQPSDIAMGDFVSGGNEEILLSFWQEDPLPGAGHLAWYERSGTKWDRGSMLPSSEGQEPLALSVVQYFSAPYAFFVNSGSDTIGSWKAGNKPGTLNTGRSPTALVACELNGGAMDKRFSLISADTSDSTVTVHILDSKGKFNRLPSVAVCAQPSALWCGNANNDGVADLIVGCDGDGSTPPVAELYYGGGNGSFLREKSQVQRPGSGPIVVVAGPGGLRSIIAANERRGTTWAAAARP